MKKLRMAACALACMMTLVACDPELISGTATLTVSNSSAATFYEDGAEVSLTSSVNDCYLADSGKVNNIILSANMDLANTNKVAEPYMGISLNDTAVQSYTINNVVTTDIIRSLTVSGILTQLSDANLLVVAPNDTCFYVSKAGSITLNEFPAYGSMVSGTCNNVTAYFITVSQVEALRAMSDAEIANVNLDNYFATVTLNGEFNSRRLQVADLIEDMASRGYLPELN